jgi:hypothetical protein
MDDTSGGTTSTFPLCDRFMQYFGQTSRFVTNNMECPLLYKHFQQIAVPYLLCRDSYKLQLVLERVGFHNQLHSIFSIHAQAYHIYKKSNVELIDEVDRLVANANYYRYRQQHTSGKNTGNNDHSSSNQTKVTKKPPQFTSPIRAIRSKIVAMSPASASLVNGMETIYKFTNSSQWSRSYTGNTLIFCLDKAEHVARYLRSTDHFQSIGWSCTSVILRSIHDVLWRLDSFTNYGNCGGQNGHAYASGSHSAHSPTFDCLILDVDIEKVLSKRNSSSSSGYGNVMEDAYAIEDIKGLIHVIRSYGFTGLIVVTHPNPEKFYRSTGSSAFSRSISDRANYYLERRRKLESHSPYADAVNIDLHLTLPLTESSAQQIARMCEWNVYKSL